jgi:hypothetical protein
LASFDALSRIHFGARFNLCPFRALGVIEDRVYFIGHDRHFNGYEPLRCADDAAATDQAKRLVNRNGIELWSGVRLVARLILETK